MTRVKKPVVLAQPATVDAAVFLPDLRNLIQSARQRIAAAAYSTQTLLCWHLGRRLLNENLQGNRGAYGKQTLVTVSQELTAEYGSGFSYPEITRMVQFAQLFLDEAIVVTLSQQLSWSHVHALLPIKDPLARDFYAEMCRIERWDVRTLRTKIGGMLFERTALSKKPKAIVATEIAKLRDGQLSPDMVFRDPYERGATLITTNRVYKQWAGIFNNDAVLTSALLDRLLHHAETVRIEGTCYRSKDQVEV